MNKFYLASPFFNEREREIKAQVKAQIESLNGEVIDPQGGGNPISWEQHNSEWGSKIFAKDVERIKEADAVIAIDWGLYGDCGTAWEIGYAFACKKPILVVVPDETLNTPHSLMIANGSHNFISVSRFLSLSPDEDFIVKGNRPCFLYGVEQK